MQFRPTSIPAVIEITPHLISDPRGYFFESFRKSVFAENGISEDFVQENQSWSSGGTLRGLHFQIAPHAQSKLVRCLHGSIFDVAVDIRPQSPTFGQWVSCTLSAELNNALYIPTGFAHGFYVLSDTATVSYKCGVFYNRESERSLRWNDPTINIAWPIDPKHPPLLSEKDLNAPLFSKDVFTSL